MNTMYEVSNDFMEIIAGTTNTISQAYREAASHFNEAGVDNKGLAYLKKFIISIESLAKNAKVSDKRISASKGNIRNFSDYENISFMMQFLQKNLGNIPAVSDLKKIHDSLILYQPEYENGYTMGARLIQLEYESALYMLITGLVSTMANDIDVVQNGTSIKIEKKADSGKDMISKMTKDMATQLTDKNHKSYLETMLGATEYTKDNQSLKESSDMDPELYTESVVLDTFVIIQNLFNNFNSIRTHGKKIFSSIKRSFFGILPMIRGVMYLHYKKKADHILALDQQCQWIKLNIEQLQRRTDMNPQEKAQIIKKQQATIAAYQKKAAKLRAELSENQKDASAELKKDTPAITNAGKDDGDLVLESTDNLFDYLMEKGNPNSFKAKRDAQFLRSNVKKKLIPDKDETGLSDEMIRATLNKVFKNIESKHGTPSIQLTIGKGVKEDTIDKRTATKFGGIPYWPADMKWPQHKKKDLVMIAQINFGDLPPIPDYPSSGILQLFVTKDIEDGVCVPVYHKEIVKGTKVLDDVPLVNTSFPKYDQFPFNEVFYPTAKKVVSIPNNSEDHWDDVFTPEVNDAFRTNWKSWLDMPDKILRIAWEMQKKKYYPYGSKIGGHPYFVQADPRRSEEKSALLLQIDSDRGIMFGDNGSSQFFCSKNNIKNCRFTEKTVTFTWSCY